LRFVILTGSEPRYSLSFGLASDVLNPQPCVRVSKIALWPIELVEIKAGQKYRGRLDPMQTDQSLKITTVGCASPMFAFYTSR
jgi:hypothetical protein